MNSFEQKLNALREEALAKNTVAYGEKAAKYIDDVAGGALKTGVLLGLLSDVPPPLMEVLINRFSNLSTRLHDAEGRLQGFTEDETEQYITLGHQQAYAFRDAAFRVERPAPSIVVPSYMH